MSNRLIREISQDSLLMLSDFVLYYPKCCITKRFQEIIKRYFMPKNFALTGSSGYVTPRHLKAIKDTGENLVATVDPNDSSGDRDKYFEDVRFFTEFERFDRHLDKLRREGEGKAIDFISICSPNYLHDAHCRLALRIGADAICEKPVVLNPWNIDALQELEQESGKKIYTILQLRVHPALIKRKQKLDQAKTGKKKEVNLT